MAEDELCYPTSTVNVSRLRRRSSGSHAVSSTCAITSKTSCPSLLTVKQELTQMSKMEARQPRDVTAAPINRIYEYQVGDIYLSEPSLVRPVPLKPVIIPGRTASLSEILGTELFSNGSIPSNQDIEKAVEIIRKLRQRSVSEDALPKIESRRASDTSCDKRRGKRMIRQNSAPMPRRRHSNGTCHFGSSNSAFQSVKPVLQPLPESVPEPKSLQGEVEHDASPSPVEKTEVKLPQVPSSPRSLSSTSSSSSRSSSPEPDPSNSDNVEVDSLPVPLARARLRHSSDTAVLRRTIDTTTSPALSPALSKPMSSRQKSALERNRRNRIRSQKCSQPSISEYEIDECLDRQLRYSPNTHPRALLPSQIANCNGNHPPVSYLNSLKRSKSMQVKHVPSTGFQKVPVLHKKDTGEFRVFNPTRIRPASPPQQITERITVPGGMVTIEPSQQPGNTSPRSTDNGVRDTSPNPTGMSHIEENVWVEEDAHVRVAASLQCYSNDIDEVIKQRSSRHFEDELQSFLVKSENFSSNKQGEEVDKLKPDKISDILGVIQTERAVSSPPTLLPHPPPFHLMVPDKPAATAESSGEPSITGCSNTPKQSRDSGYSESTSNSAEALHPRPPQRTRSTSLSFISKLKPFLRRTLRKPPKNVIEDNPFDAILKNDPIAHFKKSLDDLIHRRLSLQDPINLARYTPISSQSSVFEETSIRLDGSEGVTGEDNTRLESGLSSMMVTDDEFVEVSPIPGSRATPYEYMRRSLIGVHDTSEPYSLNPVTDSDAKFSLKHIQEILDCFEAAKNTPHEYADAGAIKEVIESQVAISLSSIYETLINSKIPPNEAESFALPILENTLDYLDEVLDVEDDNEDVMELVGLIESLEALISLHDEVISRKYYENETLPEVNPSKKFTVLDDGEERPAKQSIYRMVGLHKNRDEPLGITLKKEDDKVIVHRILAGGMIDRQKLLHIGDEIVSINGQAVEPKPDVIQSKLRNIEGDIQLKIVPSYKEQSPHCQVFVKALFNYNPQTDDHIPCKEAGLTFKEGDILQIVNQDDPNWWQAKIEGGEGQAGLIPGLILLEQRMAGQAPTPDNGTYVGCGPVSRKKKKKKLNYSANKNSEFDQHELNLYEEVAKMPPFNRKTLVLIGAQGVGRRSLISKLVLNEPDKFGNTMPHTSRPMRTGEKDGSGYWFTSREKMNEDIGNHKYLEYGEYEGHLYGTKLDSIRQVMRSGKMCLLDVNPQSLKILKTPEFVPYVVFIEAPPFQTLLQMHRESAQDNPHRAFSENDLKRSIEESKRLKRQYSHYFDVIIQNDDMDATYSKLYECISKLSTSPQWVPVSWVY